MAPRAYWKGHIRLSLVSFPVQLYSATATGARVEFHQIHRRAGRRVRYQKIVPDVGPIDKDDIVKGYEVEKDQLRHRRGRRGARRAQGRESKHTIDLVQFVGAHEIDPLYFEKPYFVVPDGEMAQEAYRVIRKALRDSGQGGAGPGRAERPRASRGDPAVRQGHAAGDAALGGRGRRRARPTSPRSRKARSTRTSWRWPAELIERKTAPFDPAQVRRPLRGGAARADRGQGRGHARCGSSPRPSPARRGDRPDGGLEEEPGEEREGRCRTGRGARSAGARARPRRPRRQAPPGKEPAKRPGEAPACQDASSARRRKSA